MKLTPEVEQQIQRMNELEKQLKEAKFQNENPIFPAVLVGPQPFPEDVQLPCAILTAGMHLNWFRITCLVATSFTTSSAQESEKQALAIGDRLHELYGWRCMYGIERFGAHFYRVLHYHVGF